MGGLHANLQAVTAPLDFFNDIKTAVNNELIHVPSFLPKARDAIATSLGSAEFMLEQGIIPSADDGKVVGHLVD